MKHWENKTLDNIPGEIWRNIPNDIYHKISNMGRVKMTGRYTKDRYGHKHFQSAYIKPLWPKGKIGWLFVTLRKDERTKADRAVITNKKVIDLVGKMFVGELKPNQEYWFINGDVTDNRADNIKITTKRSNKCRGIPDEPFMHYKNTDGFRYNTIAYIRWLENGNGEFDNDHNLIAKRCKGECGKMLPLDEFFIDESNSVTGHGAKCKICRGKIRGRKNAGAGIAAKKIADALFKQGKKKCPKCGHIKPTNEFGYDKHEPNEISVRCKKCHIIARTSSRHKISFEEAELYHKLKSVGKKKCGECEQIKPISEFNKAEARKIFGKCKICS